MWDLTAIVTVVFEMMSWLVGGLNPPEKYQFVSWDDDIPNIWKEESIHVPNHQPNNIHYHIPYR